MSAMSFALIVTLVVTCASVRVDDWYEEDRGNSANSTERKTGTSAACALESCAATGLGRYEVRGPNAAGLSQRLRPETRYFVSSNCKGTPPIEAKATIVQWLDAKDPVNNSSIAVYLNPLLENRLRGNVMKLCAVGNGLEESSWCLCQLTGQKGLGAVGSLARLLPQAISQKLVRMQHRCPGGVLDLLAATVMTLALLVVGVTLHAVLRTWKASKSDSAESIVSNSAVAALVVKTPMQSFFTSYSWAVGYVTSLAGLQMGALIFVRKSSDSEESIWFVAAFPVILAIAGVFRLLTLLCKQQLAHACLQQRCVLTKPLASPYMDIGLLIMMGFYLAVVLTLVASNLQGLLVALVTLAGSAWALLKAVQVARDLEAKLHLLEVNSEKSEEFETSNLKLIPWSSLITAGRSGLKIPKFLANPNVTETEGLDFNLRDILWQNRSIHDLTGSPVAFLILPSLVALVAVSLGTSALHMALYACSCGELSDLQMASGLHGLNFTAHQDKYEVMLDISFRQVAMVASAPGANTRWINFTQPFEDDAPEQHMVSDRSSSATVEIHLPPRRVPRVADVHVQGLRLSLDATEYQVRFSPLTTVPTLLEIEAEDFKRKVVWSTLPGSIISVPAEGVDNFTIRVTLSDYFLNLPLPPHSVSNLPLWTEFSPTSNATEAACSTSCSHSLNCFDFFVAETGCFFVRGNRSQLSNRSLDWSSDLSAAGLRNLSGHLFGCTNGAEQPGACGAKAALADGIVTFREVSPDWHGKDTTLTFTLVLEVGEQRFYSEVGTIQLHRGPPMPSDVLAVLLGDSENGTQLINATTTIDPLGNVVVNVSKYDPMKLQQLRLLVVPLLSDEAFVAAREASNFDIDDLRYFKDSERCLGSPFLQARYCVCGANQGRPDEPMVLSLDLFTGQPLEGNHFSIYSREDNQKHQRVESGKIIMFFQSVDSPVAWAVEEHGLDLLDQKYELFILSSADACVLLLQLEQQLAHGKMPRTCSTMDEKGLGKKYMHQYMHYVPPGVPPLPQDGTIKVMLALQSAGCKIANSWDYSHNRRDLELSGHTFKVSMQSLLLQISETEEKQAMSFLRSVKGDKVSIDLTQMAWQFLDPALLPKVLRVLANFTSDMPKLLLNGLINSPRLELEALLSMDLETTAEAFRSVKSFTAVSASSWGLVAVALRLSAGLEELQLVCGHCAARMGTPSAHDWKLISPFMGKLKGFKMRHFRIPKFPMQLFQFSTSLQTLDLARNEMSQLPEELPATLSHLKKLDLSYNNFAELPENFFQQVTGLEEIKLELNKFRKLPEKIFVNLEKLKELNLVRNQLTELPEKIFVNLEKLEELDLGENQLTELPEKIFVNLEKLEWLELVRNQLTELPEKVFQNLKELKKLSLHMNQLTELPEKIFVNLAKLEWLNLSMNQLTELPEKTFVNLEKLEVLDLGENQLTELPEKIFVNLEKLEELDLVRNQLTELPEKVFQNLKELKQLHLVDNHLTELPENVFAGLQKLTSLRLTRNPLTKMPVQHLESD